MQIIFFMYILFHVFCLQLFYQSVKLKLFIQYNARFTNIFMKSLYVYICRNVLYKTYNYYIFYYFLKTCILIDFILTLVLKYVNIT